jgi:hypothetical protein
MVGHNNLFDVNNENFIRGFCSIVLRANYGDEREAQIQLKNIT